jgi:hypothetical protein
MSWGFWIGILGVLLVAGVLLTLTRQILVTQLFLAVLRVGVLAFGGGSPRFLSSNTKSSPSLDG